MKRWIVERRSQLIAGAWCNVREIEAATWWDARQKYASDDGVDPCSADVRATELTALNVRC